MDSLTDGIVLWGFPGERLEAYVEAIESPCQGEHRLEQVSHGAPTGGRIRGIADGQGLH